VVATLDASPGHLAVDVLSIVRADVAGTSPAVRDLSSGHVFFVQLTIRGLEEDLREEGKALSCCKPPRSWR
jgi:hypothetical protein